MIFIKEIIDLARRTLEKRRILEYNRWPDGYLNQRKYSSSRLDTQHVSNQVAKEA